MSLELPGAKLLPSATYSGKGEYQSPSANLYYPSSGDVVISPNLVVEGRAEVGEGITGIGGAGLVMPSGAVGGTPSAPTTLPLPKGIFMSDLGNAPSQITAGATAGGAFVVDFQHGIRTQESAFFAQGGGSVIVGSPTTTSVFSSGNYNAGSITNPIVVAGPFTPPTANIQRITISGNRAWFLIPASTGFGNGTILVVSQDPALGGNGIGRILPAMTPPFGTAGLSLTLGGGYGGPSDFTFINSLFGGGGGSTWLVGVEFL